MGYPRLPVEKQCELAPTLLTAMEGKPQPQQDRYNILSIKLSLPNCKKKIIPFNKLAIKDCKFMFREMMA